MAGGLTRDDELDITAELDALVAEDTSRDLERLPNVPEQSHHSNSDFLHNHFDIHLNSGQRERGPVVSPTRTKQRVLATAD